MSDSTTLDFVRGTVAKTTFDLRRLPPPCCQLAGAWQADLWVSDPGAMKKTHAGATTGGRIVFDARIPDPMAARYDLGDPVVRYEFGRHMIDLTPILGGPYGRDVSTTVFGGGGSSLLVEVVGLIESGDSVTLAVIPRMSHGGLSLRGRLQGDTITGRWRQNAYCCGATGSFTMRRMPWMAGDDSLVSVAVRRFAEDSLAAARAQGAAEKRAGRFLVRTFDVASHRYVEATYWISRTTDAPADRMWEEVTSSDSGWSGAIGLEPGTYGVKLSDYPCGDKRYFADTSYVRREMPQVSIFVRSGAEVRLDDTINIRTIVATSSYDNLRAVSCKP